MDSGILSISILAVLSLIYTIAKSLFDTDIKKKEKIFKYGVPTWVNAKDENNKDIVILSKGTLQFVIFIVYLVLLLILQVLTSVISFQNSAGESDISKKIPTIIFYTLIPWFIMFGSLITLLKASPGWKMPFSNTFGYMIVQLLGIKKLVNKLVIAYDDDGNPIAGDDNDPAFNRAVRALRPITNDPSYIVNEITDENFDNFWTTMTLGKLLKTSETYSADYPGETLDDGKDRLKQFISIKENMAEFIWFILAGAYIASYVQTLLTTIDVPVSDEELNNTLNQQTTEDDTTTSSKVYVNEE